MNKKRILIIDDEKDIQHLLKTYLERNNNIEVISAYSGEKGVAIYKKLFDKKEDPVLLIMDLNLSDGESNLTDINLHIDGKDKKMDGVRTTQKILKINPKAVIWGYTAWFGTHWSDKLKKSGAKKVVDRIVPFKEFSQMINAFLNG